MSTLVIVDQSLRDVRGHHYELASNITQGALLQGLQVFWFTHVDFPHHNTPDGVVVRRLFTTTMYDRYLPATVPEASRVRTVCLAAFGKLVRLGQRLTHRFGLVMIRSLGKRALRRTHASNDREVPPVPRIVLAALERDRIGPDSHVLFHTADGNTYADVLRLMLTANTSALPFFHLATPYDQTTMPNQDSADSVAKAVRDLGLIGVLDRKVFLYGENDLLADALADWFGAEVKPLNLPPPARSTIGPGKEHPVAASYFGAAREEKGFLLLPGLMARLFESHGKTRRLRFVIQCSPQIVGYSPAILKAIDQLKKYPRYYVELRNKAQTTDQYYRMLNDTSVVLVCYDAERYRVRGSGIAVEAVSSGKILLGTPGTFPVHLAGEASKNGSTIEELAAALSDIVDHIGDYRDRAARAAKHYRQRYSSAKYTETLLHSAETVQAAGAEVLDRDGIKVAQEYEATGRDALDQCWQGIDKQTSLLLSPANKDRRGGKESDGGRPPHFGDKLDQWLG